MAHPNFPKLSAVTILLALLLAFLAGVPVAQAQEPLPPLAEAQIQIVGLELQPAPATLVVPKNVGTIITPLLVRTDGTTGNLPQVPEDSIFLAELRGPAFGTPIPLSAQLNESFSIPPLPLAGDYTLANIRLVSSGEILLQGNPDTVEIEVIEKVLVSQVTSRPLTAEEIEEKGIFIDQTNFQVVNFTVAFGLQDQKIIIDFPMIMPAGTQEQLIPARPQIPVNTGVSAGSGLAGMIPPRLSERLRTPNIEITGFSLSIPEEDEPKLRSLLPDIPGVIIIPGNIAYLNQFFSVLLKVSNAAPGYSNLVVKDLKAEIVLPDGYPNPNDKPLAMARLGNPPVEQPLIKSVVQPGPDNKLGTADDILDIAPQQSGDAEFLVEGRREGVHEVNFKITATLHGLPGGPLPLSGRAVGIVEVRDPTFALTFHHPHTVTAGEEYDLLVTVSNVSETPANFASLSLLPRSISGATLLSDQTVQIQTIAPGDAQSATFRLRALKSGAVTATSIATEGVPGKFELRAAVGDLGIPLSPNSLVLSPEANHLPDNLYNTGLALLGQAHALATSPLPPKGLLPIGRAIVHERATDLTAAGQRAGLAEPLLSVARDLALDFLGNNFTRIAERFPQDSARQDSAKQDYRGFDLLLRRSQRGAAFLQAAAAIYGDAVEQVGVLDFQADFAQATASRPAHVSVIVGADNGPAPVLLHITDPAGKQLGRTSLDGPVLQEVPYGAFFSLIEDAPSFSQMALMAVPQPGQHRVEVIGTDDGAFDLGLVIPEGTSGSAPFGANSSLRRLAFENVPIHAGERAWLIFEIGGENTYQLAVDEDGDGIADEEVSPVANEVVEDRGPQPLSAVQIYTGKKDGTRFGQVIGVLFSEEIDIASHHELEAQEIAGFYQPQANEALGLAVQPGGRVVFLYLRDGVGPLVPRTITVAKVEDRLGNIMAPFSTTLSISATIPVAGGVVSGTVRQADGTPIPHAQIRYSTLELDLNDEVYWMPVTTKRADAEGRYALDFVLARPSRFEFIEMESAERGNVVTTIAYHGQRMLLDLILHGTGTLAGRVLAADGVTPLPGAAVRAMNPAHDGQAWYGAVADENGYFVINAIPVGNLIVEAAHQPSRSKRIEAVNLPLAGNTVVHDLLLIPVADPQVARGSLQGRVFRADGVTPVPEVTVYTTYGITTTDALGSYRLNGLPVGRIQVSVIDPVLWEEAQVETTIVANYTTTADLLLSGGRGTIEGVVLNAEGEPVPNILIGGGPVFLYTDDEGRFTMHDVGVGPAQIQALDETRNVMAQTAALITHPGEEVNVLLVLPATGTITGKVYLADGTTPAPNIKVIVFGPGVWKTFTDASGAYTVEQMPVGDYTVSAFLSDFSDGNITKTKLVFQDEVRSANVVFRGKGIVTGIVYDDDGVTPLGAKVGLGEDVVKFGELAPPENPTCESGEIAQLLKLPPCETVPVGFEYKQRRRIINNDVASGTFTFNDVFVGDILVEAANPFSPQAISAKETIPAANTTVSVTLSLQSTGVVTGVVYQPNGVTPAGAGVVVTLFSPTAKEIPVVTDAQGHFHFPLIPAGGFSMKATDHENGLVSVVTSGQVGVGKSVAIPLRLLRRGTVSVTVTGSNGPVQNANVTLQQIEIQNEKRQGVTNATGVITFAGGDDISEGRFMVNVYDAASGVSGSASGSLPGIATSPNGHVEIQIVLRDDAGSVRGQFLRTGGVTPIPNAQVRLSAGNRELFAVTDADGRYVFNGVLVGAFTLDAYDPLTNRRSQGSGSLTSAGQQLVLNLIELPMGAVSGTVRRSSDHAPLASLRVVLIPSGPFNQYQYTSTGLDGAFRFPTVAAGNIQIQVEKEGPGGYSSIASASGTLSQQGQEVVLDVVIQEPKRGRIEGRVTRSDGTPAQGATVRISGPGLSATYPAQTTVDSSGYYFFEQVPLGTFSLLAKPQAGSDAGLASGSVAFDGDVEEVDIQYVGTGTVTGTVTTGAGEPAAFTRVYLVRKGSDPESYSAETQTDSNGQFHFNSVLVGEINVSAKQAVSELAGAASGLLNDPGDTLGLNVSLEPTGIVRGRVLRADGQTPAALMALELVKQGVSYFGATKADGTFAFDLVKLGNYQLKVTDPLGDGIANAQASVNSQGQVVELGDLILDTERPSIVNISPANGAIQVPVTQTIRVRFSEAVRVESVNTTNLVVSSGSTVIAGMWKLSEGDTLATFTPTLPFRDFAQINLRVKTNVKDRVDRNLRQEGVLFFTTADSTPPAITTLSPAPNAQAVALNAVVRVNYAEIIVPGQFTAPAIVLRKGNETVAGRLDYILNNTVVVFTPNAALSSNTIYQVEIAAATDRFGNKQAHGEEYTFETVDLVAPVLRALSASSGTTVRAGTKANIVPDIEAAPDIAQVEFFVNGQSRYIAKTDPYTFELSIDPAATSSSGPPVAGGTTVAVMAKVMDRSGNVSEAKQLNLTIQPDLAPEMTIVSPAADTPVKSGSRVTVTVHAEDDLGLSKIFFQAKGAATANTATDVPANTTTFTTTFTVDVPSNATPGSLLEIATSATDRAGKASAIRTLALPISDHTAPSLHFTAPVSGSAVNAGATIDVVVTANDNGTLHALALKASGAATFTETRTLSSTSPVSVTFQVPVAATARYTESIVLVATVEDEGGNHALATMNLAIRDGEAPVVTVLLPGGIDQVPQGTTIAIGVAASDNERLAAVALQTAGGLVTSQSKIMTPPGGNANVTFDLTIPYTVTAGTVLTLTGGAVDTTGNTGSSEPVTLTVKGDELPTVSILATVVPPATGGPDNEGDILGTGATIQVSVATSDDVGVTQVRLESSGIVTGNSLATITPPALERTTLFTIEIPANAPLGSSLVLTATAVDTRDQVGESVPLTLTVTADHTRPTIEILAPDDGATVDPAEVISLDIAAQDNDAVATIHLLVEGALALTETHQITPAQPTVAVNLPITVPATATANEKVKVSVWAEDASGNLTMAAIRLFNIRDIFSPVVEVELPAGVSEVIAGTTLTATVAAGDEVGVSRIDFATSGAVTISASENVSPAEHNVAHPFQISVPVTASAGSVLVINGVAADMAGNVGTADPISVTVVVDEKPQVAISAVTEVSSGSQVTVTVAATDDNGLTQLLFAATGAASTMEVVTLTMPAASYTHTFMLDIPVDAQLASQIQLYARAIDTRKQMGDATPATLTVVDATPPSVQIDAPGNNSEVNPGDIVAITVKASDNGLVEHFDLTATGAISLTQSRELSPALPAPSAIFTITVPVTTPARSTFTVAVVAVDSADNHSLPASIQLKVRDILQPEATLTVAAGLVEIFQGSTFTATLSATDNVGIANFTLRMTGAMATTQNRSINPALPAAAHTFTIEVPRTIAPGSQVVVSGEASDEANNKGSSQPLTLTVVAPPTLVTGRVTDAADNLVAGATITVTAQNGTFHTTTGASGQYTVTGIVAGSVTVKATAPNGLRRTVTGSLGVDATTLTLDARIPDAPVVSIVAPVTGTAVIEGATVTVTFAANSEVAIAQVTLFADGTPVATVTTAPYHAELVIPLDVERVVLGARAVDSEGNIGMATEVVLQVLPDDHTIVTGRVVDESNNPVPGASVMTVENHSATTGADGNFVIAGVPTAQGAIQVTARATIAGKSHTGKSASVAPVVGGTTYVGDIIVKVAKVWDGGGDGVSWHQAANWNDNILPAATDDVYIPITGTVTHSSGSTSIRSLYSDGPLTLSGGTLTIAAPSTINHRFTQSGGTLTGSDSITITQAMTWTGGTIAGSGSIVNMGNLTIDSSSIKYLEGRHLENKGTMIWRGTGDIWAYNGGVLHNHTGSTIAVQSNIRFYWPGWGSKSTFANDGTLTKSSSGTNQIDATFTNNGSLNIQAGTWQLNGGGTNNGLLTLSTDAIVLLNANYTFNDTSTISGTGTVHFYNGTINVNGLYNVGKTIVGSGTINFNASATLTSLGSEPIINGSGTLNLSSGESLTFARLSLSSGTLSGSDHITITETMTWTGGTIAGSGNLVTLGNLTLDSSTIKYLEGRHLENKGNMIWRGTGDIWAYNGAVLHNQTNATVTIESNIKFYWPGWGAKSIFVNDGTVTKSSSGINQIDATFDNNGTVNIQAGTWQLNSGGTNNALLALPTDATLLFGTNYTLNNTSTISGTGTVHFYNGTINVNGLYNVGKTIVTYGTVNFTPNATLTSFGSEPIINGSGTLNLSSGESLTFARLSLPGGTLTGSDSITVTQAMTWTGGTIAGNGNLVTLGNLTIESSSIKYLEGRHLENKGNIFLRGTGDIWAYNGAVLHNHAGATIAIQDASEPYWPGWGSKPTFTNDGTVTKSSSGISQIDTAFANNGTVNIQAGTWQLNGGGTNNALINLSADAILLLNANYTLGNSSSISGTGTVHFYNGTINVNGLYNVGKTSVTYGTANFNASALVTSLGSEPVINGSGTLNLSSGETLTFTRLSLSSGTLSGSDHITVTEAMTWTGGTIVGTGNIVNLGNFTIDSSTIKYLEGRHLENKGNMIWRGTGDIWAYNGAMLHNHAGATIAIQSNIKFYWPGWGSRPTFANDGTLTKGSSGVSQIDATFTNGGTVDVQTGILQFGAAYQQMGAGKVALAIAGPTPSTQLSQVKVSGAATFSGTLAISLTNGYQPIVGDHLTILTYGSRSGTFATSEGMDVGNGTHLEPSYNPTGLDLNVMDGGDPSMASFMAPTQRKAAIDLGDNSVEEAESTESGEGTGSEPTDDAAILEVDEVELEDTDAPDLSETSTITTVSTITTSTTITNGAELTQGDTLSDTVGSDEPAVVEANVDGTDVIQPDGEGDGTTLSTQNLYLPVLHMMAQPNRMGDGVAVSTLNVYLPFVGSASQVTVQKTPTAAGE